MSLEQFEVGFMRTCIRRARFALWCSITAAWLAYHEKFLAARHCLTVRSGIAGRTDRNIPGVEDVSKSRAGSRSGAGCSGATATWED